MRRLSIGILLVSSVLALSACTGPGTSPDTDTDPDSSSGSGGETGSGSDSGSESPTGSSTEDPAQGALDLPKTPYNYADLDLPAHYLESLERDMDNTPVGNPITDDGATLGRVLFYDTALSANRTVSCASCHSQKNGFADTDKLSKGFDGGLTGRNSMGLTEARYYRNGRFFWDERAATLEEQVLQPIQNSVEMGLTLDELVERVEAEDYYAPLFARAFGDSEITSGRISRALAQFVRSMVSFNARYDDGVASTGTVVGPFPGFTAQENQGKALFFGKAGCAACHLDNGPAQPGTPPGQPPARVNQGIFFIDFATNNGLPVLNDDIGVGAVTGNPGDRNRFKSPSLRNVTVTAPYMHDGRFESLAQVVEHYDSGVEAQPNLDPRLRVPGGTDPRKLNLTEGEKAALVAFLGTLTDESFLTDPKYTNPFRADAP